MIDWTEEEIEELLYWGYNFSPWDDIYVWSISAMLMPTRDQSLLAFKSVKTIRLIRTRRQS